MVKVSGRRMMLRLDEKVTDIIHGYNCKVTARGGNVVITIPFSGRAVDTMLYRELKKVFKGGK